MKTHESAAHFRGSPGGSTVAGVDVVAAADEQVLTREALEFVARLQRELNPLRLELLERRRERQAELDAGALPGFLAETRGIREGGWSVAPAPPDLLDRRCEITGPVERKMMINALNSGARVFMADYEDANSPTWTNVVEGQRNVSDAVRRTIALDTPEKSYRLNDEVATLMIRPRGWHLPERHVLVDGEQVSAALFDFGLHMVRNAREQLERGSGPYFYLPKLESHHEARLWAQAFALAEEELALPSGSIRCTVLIETILAAFEMEEILHELRDWGCALNAGRWDYMFSVIKKFRARDWVLPDRVQVTMTVPFMRAYTELLVRSCHRRGAHAIGGMAAYIPSRKDPAVNEVALAKVRDDKERESGDGFDGTWVAHPDLVPVATEVFDRVLGERPHQVERLREDVVPDEAALLSIPDTPGSITEQGLRTNVSVGVRYLDAWLQGVGAAAIDNLMEDAATAEISRSQVWQWLRAGRFEEADVRDEIALVEAGEEAKELFAELALAPQLVEFLTLPAYTHLE
jgi:malate synthase